MGIFRERRSFGAPFTYSQIIAFLIKSLYYLHQERYPMKNQPIETADGVEYLHQASLTAPMTEETLRDYVEMFPDSQIAVEVRQLAQDERS
jgi:reverse gyrase